MGILGLLLVCMVALIPAIFVGIFIYIKDKNAIGIIGLGALAWLVSLTRTAIIQPTYLIIGSPHVPPIWFIGFSAILAGAFEEGFRYKFLKSFVDKRTWFNGIAFGLGAALCEILLIYCVPIIKTAIINPGMQTFSYMLVGAVERNFAVIIHIGCALLVMHSLKKRWILGVAITLHIALDFIVPAVGYYSSLSLWQVEYIVAAFAIISLFVVLLEKYILKNPKNQDISIGGT